MSKAAVTLSIHLGGAENLDLVFDQLADMLSDLENSDSKFTDSFIGGSIETGQFELAIVSEAHNQSEAKARAEKALISSLEKAKLICPFSYQVKNLNSESLSDLAQRA
jgi:hypothetical protein